MLLGLYDDDDNFSPLIVWEGVWYGNPFLLIWVFDIYISVSLHRNSSSVDIQFTPNISIFATSQYKESQLFMGHISAALWRHNIADATLPVKLIFNLVWDASLNTFVLSEA